MITDYEWHVTRPMLPNKSRGVPRVDDRRTLNGNFWVLRSGAPWRDLPESCGPHPTSYNRFVRWRRAGVWDQIMEALAVAHAAGMQDLQSRYSRPHIMSRQKIVFRAYSIIGPPGARQFLQRIFPNQLQHGSESPFSFAPTLSRAWRGAPCRRRRHHPSVRTG